LLSYQKFKKAEERWENQSKKLKNKDYNIRAFTEGSVATN
jgi:hypothetical protein